MRLNVAAGDLRREGQPVGASGRVHNVVLRPGFLAVAVNCRDLGARSQVDLGSGVALIAVEHQIEALGQALVTGVVLELLGTFRVLEPDGCGHAGFHLGVAVGDSLQLAFRRGQAHLLAEAGSDDDPVLVSVPGKAVVGVCFAGGKPLGGQAVADRVRQPVVTGEQNVQQLLAVRRGLEGQVVPLGQLSVPFSNGDGVLGLILVLVGGLPVVGIADLNRCLGFVRRYHELARQGFVRLFGLRQYPGRQRQQLAQRHRSPAGSRLILEGSKFQLIVAVHLLKSLGSGGVPGFILVIPVNQHQPGIIRQSDVQPELLQEVPQQILAIVHRLLPFLPGAGVVEAQKGRDLLVVRGNGQPVQIVIVALNVAGTSQRRSPDPEVEDLFHQNWQIQGVSRLAGICRVGEIRPQQGKPGSLVVVLAVQPNPLGGFIQGKAAALLGRLPLSAAVDVIGQGQFHVRRRCRIQIIGDGLAVHHPVGKQRQGTVERPVGLIRTGGADDEHREIAAGVIAVVAVAGEAAEIGHIRRPIGFGVGQVFPGFLHRRVGQVPVFRAAAVKTDFLADGGRAGKAGTVAGNVLTQKRRQRANRIGGHMRVCAQGGFLLDAGVIRANQVIPSAQSRSKVLGGHGVFPLHQADAGKFQRIAVAVPRASLSAEDTGVFALSIDQADGKGLRPITGHASPIAVLTVVQQIADPVVLQQNIRARQVGSASAQVAIQAAYAASGIAGGNIGVFNGQIFQLNLRHISRIRTPALVFHLTHRAAGGSLSDDCRMIQTDIAKGHAGIQADHAQQAAGNAVGAAAAARENLNGAALGADADPIDGHLSSRVLHQADQAAQLSAICHPDSGARFPADYHIRNGKMVGCVTGSRPMVGVGIAEIAKQAAYVALCVCVFPADQLHFSFQADALDGYGLTLGHVLVAHQTAYGDVIHPGGGVLYRQIPDGHSGVAFRVDFQSTCACIIQVNMAEESSRILTAVLNSHAEGGCRPDIAVRQLHILGISDSYLCRRGVAREAAGHNQRPNGQILIGAIDKPGFVFELGIKPDHANEASGGGAAQGVSVDAGILQRNPIEDNGVGSVGAEAADEHTRRRHIGPFRLIPQGVAVIQDIACLAGAAIAVKVGDSGLSGENQVGEGGIRGIAHRQEQAGAADRPFVLLRHILVALLVQGNDRPIAVGFFSVHCLNMQLTGIVGRCADVDAHIAAADSPEAVAVIRHVAVRREPDGKQISWGSGQLAEIPGHIFAQIALRRGLRCQADPAKAGVVLPGGGASHGIASDSGAAEAVGLVAVHRRGAAVGNSGKQPQPLRVLHRSGDIVARQRNRQVGIHGSLGGNIGNLVILIRIFQGNAVSQHIAVQHPSHIGIVVELTAGFAGLPAGQAGADLPPEHHAAAILILAAVAGSAECAAHKSHIAAHRRQIGMAALGLRQVRNGNRNAVQNGVAAKGIAHYAAKEGRADFAAGRLVAAQGNTSGIFDLDVANHAAHAVLDQAAKLAGCAARDGEGFPSAVNLAAEGDDLTAGLAGGVRMTQAVPAVVGSNVLFQLVVGVLQIEPHNRRFHGGFVLAYPFAGIRRIGIAYMSAVHIVSGVLVRIREGLLLLDVCQHLGVQFHRPVLGGSVPEHQIQGFQLAELGDDVRIRPGSAADLQSGGVQVHIQLVLGAANGQIFRLVDITCVILIEAVPAVGTAADQFVFQLSAVVPTLLIVVPAGDRAVCGVGQLPAQGALILLRLGKVIDAAGGLHIVKGLQEQSPAENAAGSAIHRGVVPSGAAIQAHFLEGQPDFLAGIAAHPADETAGGIFVGVQILVAGGGFHAVHVQGTVAAQAVNQQGLFRRTGADPDSRQIHILDRQIHPGIDGTAGEWSAA